MTPSHTESQLLEILIQLVLIITAARVAGVLFRFLGQPQVCGEIAAGLALGPSVFGLAFPHLQRVVFNPAAGTQISVLSQVGLLFMMFLIGLEFDFGYLRGSGRTAFSISSAGILAPFGLGILLGRWIHSRMNLQVDPLGFALFVATALSITAVPILGRILIEFNMAKTRLGALTISAAAMDDAIGWLLLAVVSAIVRSQLHPLHLYLAALELVLYLLVMIFVVRPLMQKWARWIMRDSGGELSLNALAQLIVFFLISAAITNWIGVFSIFGAFVMGAILYDQAELRAAVSRRMGDLVTVFFLPIFFTYTGLRTDIGSMTGSGTWLICVMIILAASVGKFGACSLAAKLSGMSWRESCSVGIMMNTRALMELIVLNTGYDLGIIPKPVFFMLVLMAVITTYVTPPVLRRLIQGTELQPHFEASQFMQHRLERLALSKIRRA